MWIFSIEKCSKITPVVKYSLKITLKGIVNHILRQNADDIAESFQEAIEEESKAIIDGLLKEYSQAKSNIDALKKCIKNAVAAKELVIFIDELDRCRPDFALNVFELVKHIFDIDGVKFIFIFNSEQIKSMIKNRYGYKVNADIYIEKFIYRTIQLPEISKNTNNTLHYNTLKIIYNYGKSININIISGDNKLFNNIFENIFIRYKISLRLSEEIVKNIKIYQNISRNYKLSEDNSPGVNFIIFLSILLYSIDKKISSNILSGAINFEKISEAIGEPKHEDYFAAYGAIKFVIKEGKNIYNHSCHQLNTEIISVMRYLFEDIFGESHKIITHTIKTLNFCG